MSETKRLYELRSISSVAVYETSADGVIVCLDSGRSLPETIYVLTERQLLNTEVGHSVITQALT
jgi:hypothetical protein